MLSYIQWGELTLPESCWRTLTIIANRHGITRHQAVDNILRERLDKLNEFEATNLSETTGGNDGAEKGERKNPQ